MVETSLVRSILLRNLQRIEVDRYSVAAAAADYASTTGRLVVETSLANSILRRNLQWCHNETAVTYCVT